MSRWLSLVLALNTIGGGFSGILQITPQALGAANTSQLGTAAISFGLIAIHAYGVYAGWLLTQSQARAMPHIRAYLYLQMPWISSPLFGFQLTSGFGFSALLCVPHGTTQIALTTQSMFGNVYWLSFLQGAPYGIGLNIVPIILFVLLRKHASCKAKGAA